MTLRFLLLGVVGAGTALAIVTAACDGPPEKTCYADHVNALGAEGDAGPQRDCTVCLQTKNAPKACCDAVGACDEDPSQQCATSFKAAHACVADGGANEESRCKALLTNDLSKNLYACMRGTCGKECGIPSCTLEPGVPLIANAQCDSCVGGACCERINTCNGNRRCKLIFDCITTSCMASFGTSMTELALASPDERRAARDGVCGGGPAPAGDACLQRCLDDFASGGPSATPDDLEARCEAFDVYACGAEASCGAKCIAPDAGEQQDADAPRDE